MKKAGTALLVIAVVLCAAAAMIYYAFYGANNFGGAAKMPVFVSKGETWEQIVDSMATKKVIRSKLLFDLVVMLSNKGTTARVGKYEMRSGITNKELYDNLRIGNGIVPIAVTLKEGRRSTSYARTLRRTLSIDSVRFIDLVRDETFARSLGVDATNLEGYLSPETYQFQWQADEGEILRRLVQQTDRVFTDSVLHFMRRRGMTRHQALTLASIIEGETSREDERAIISGVYHNRLRKGMRLEADPTIQFIIPDGPRRVLFTDLQIKSPYNTYINYGLPPGPISNPRAASILAAVNPAKHNYLFFVANGHGGHWFARDFAGHLVNAKRFRREREAQIREQSVQ